MTHFLRTNEIEEAVSALEMVSESLLAAQFDLYRWKWALVALHSAVQGFMVLALRGTNGFDVLSDKATKAYMEAHKNGSPRPGEELDRYLGLYRKVKSDRMLRYGHSKKFVPRGSQGASIKMLNGLRNEFIHFLPKGWSLEVGWLPHLFEDCLNMIEFLGWESGNVIWYEEDFETRAKSAMSSARAAIGRLEACYASS